MYEECRKNYEKIYIKLFKKIKLFFKNLKIINSTCIFLCAFCLPPEWQQSDSAVFRLPPCSEELMGEVAEKGQRLERSSQFPQDYNRK